MLSTESDSTRYRLAWWTTLSNLASCLFLALFMSVIACILVFLIFFLFQNERLQAFGMILLASFALFAVFGSLLLLYFTVLLTGRVLFSYIKISPDGLEYRFWPAYAVRCGWDDVERLEKRPSFGLIPSDTLYLKKGEPFGLPITMALRQGLGLSTQYFVPLSGFQGWPAGGLADALKQYAPQVFTARESDE